MKRLFIILVLLMTTQVFAGLDAKGGKVINVATPTDLTDAANKQYVDNTVAATFGIINVKDYGAVGDGGTDDTTAINNAKVEALASGKALYFPAGIYKVTSTIVFAGGSKITIIGDGVNLTRIYIDTVDLNLFEIGDSATETNNWHISDMSLGTAAGVGNAGGSGYVLQLQRTHRGSMENVSIPGCGGGTSIGTAEGGGVKMDFVVGALFKNVHISGYEPDITGARPFPNWSEAGFLFESVLGLGSCNAITFIDCVVTHVTQDYLSLTVAAANGITILGGNLESNDFAIKLVGSEGWKIHTWLESAPIYLENCKNILIDCPLLIDDIASETALQLVNCDHISVENTPIGGVVLVDSDSDFTALTNVRFINNNSLRNDSLTTTINNCMIASVTEERNKRTYGSVTRNHQIDDGVGDFETWVSVAPDVAQPQGWFRNNAPKSNREDTIVHSGKYSLKIESSGGANQGINFRVPDEFLNCWITIEGFIYISSLAGSNAPRISMSVTDPGESSYIFFSPTTGRWNKFQFSFFKASGSFEQIRIQSAADGDIFYLDSIKIYAEFNPYGTMITLGDGSADDTTPDVYNPGGPNRFVIFQQNNNTQVTDFDAYAATTALRDGQTITIIDGDGKSDFVDGTPMQLSGGINYDTDQYDTLTLMFYQGKWHELSRKVGSGKVIIGSDPPATASSTGTAGTITYDSDYFYVAVATDTWKRTALSTWAVVTENVIFAGENVIFAGEQVVY